MILPICFYCTHKIKGRLKCDAFGERLIPDEILGGKNNHSAPLVNQENILIFKSDQAVELVDIE